MNLLVKEWEKTDRKGVAPQLIKQLVITKYQNQFKLDTLIETGTYLGDMIFAQKEIFPKLISIELNEKLFQRAKERFKNYDHIHLYQGDSGVVLKEILSKTFNPCLFWLDGHYSGDITSKGQLNTPILNELNFILTHSSEHVILIDDARLFTGQQDYPTLEEVKKFVSKFKPGYKFEVKHDIIRIHA
jgi:hypothetical protein